MNNYYHYIWSGIFTNNHIIFNGLLLLLLLYKWWLDRFDICLDYSKSHKETGNSVFGSHWSSKFALFFAQEMWVNAWRMLCCITNTCINLTCPIFLQKYGKFAWKYSHLSISITMNNAIADLCVHLKSFSITKIIIYWFIWKKKHFN